MSRSKSIVFFLSTFFLNSFISAQVPVGNNFLSQDDTTFTLFKNPKSILRLKVFREVDTDLNETNAVLTLTVLNLAEKSVVFRDSLHVSSLNFDMADFNGDGVKDLAISHHMSIGRSNMAYSLYLVDPKRKTLVKVKGFEKIYTPEYDKKRKAVMSSVLYGRYIGYASYKIDTRGRLKKVSRDYEELAN